MAPLQPNWIFVNRPVAGDWDQSLSRGLRSRLAAGSESLATASQQTLQATRRQVSARVKRRYYSPINDVQIDIRFNDVGLLVVLFGRFTMPKNSAPASGGFAGPFRVHGSSGVSSKGRPKDVQISWRGEYP